MAKWHWRSLKLLERVDACECDQLTFNLFLSHSTVFYSHRTQEIFFPELIVNEIENIGGGIDIDIDEG